MSFSEVQKLSRDVIKKFDKIEQRPWSVETVVLELVKQVGDLTKCILTFEGYYLQDRSEKSAYATDKKRIGNELADILHQIIHIADYYDIDLLESHIDARKCEEKYIELQAGVIEREK